MQEKTIYLLQRVGSEQLEWSDQLGKDKPKMKYFYVTLAKFDRRAEALSVCKYELKRTGQTHRIITERAWLSQATEGERQATPSPTSKPIKRASVTTARGRTVNPVRRVKLTPKARQYNQSSYEQLDKPTYNLWSLLKKIW